VSYSETESAVVLQCLMLLAAFPTPLGRDFSDFLLLLVEISVISLHLLVLITDEQLHPLNSWFFFSG